MIKHERNTGGGDDRGAKLVEYAMLIALILIVCVVALTYFGGKNDQGLQKSKDCILNAENPPSGC